VDIGLTVIHRSNDVYAAQCYQYANIAPKQKVKLIFPSLNLPDMSFPLKILLKLDIKKTGLQYTSDASRGITDVTKPSS
jgi:hypothetical protein